MRLLYLLIIAFCFTSCLDLNEDDGLNDDQGGPITNCVETYDVEAPPGYNITFVGEITEPFIYASSFQFVNESVGYVRGLTQAGSYMRILKTVDGGATWDLLNLNENYSDRYMAFKNEMEGIASTYSTTGCPDNCVYRSIIFKTTDGGETWVKNEFPEMAEVLHHPQFDNNGDLYGYLGHEDSKIMKSSDGGETWETIYELADLSFSLITFSFTLFEDKLYLSGRDGRVIVIKKDGQLDRIIETGQSNIWDLKILDDDNLVMTTTGAVIKSIDGGANWSTIYQNSARLLDFESSDEGIMLLNFDSCNTDIYQVNDFIGITQNGGEDWETGNFVTNLRANFNGAQRIEEGSYWLMVENTLYRLDKI